MVFANVIVDISHEKLDKIFQYIIPKSLEPSVKVGAQVIIPFGNGNRQIKGYVIEITDQSDFPVEKTKSIISVSDGIAIESQLIELAWWIKENYGSTMNQALKTVLPVKHKIKPIVKKTIVLNLPIMEAEEKLLKFKKSNAKARARLLEELIKEQQLPRDIVVNKLNVTDSVIKALEELKIVRVEENEVYRISLEKTGNDIVKADLTKDQQLIVNNINHSMDNEKSVTHLIHGVTGSGKTEVYMELIAHAIETGKEVIVLIPEIALTYQIVMRFHRRFGDKIAIINSRMSAGERYEQFERAKNGKVSIMIGPRSALFTPFAHLGLIIIDEEHEGAYKSESVPKYHAREVAIKRAEMCQAMVVLGSATPSVDSYYRALNGEYRLHKLKNRIGNKNMAEVEVVDLREELKNGNKSIFSIRLQQLIQDRLNKKEQIILFINRRGYAGFVSCRSCGEAIKCPHCDVTLTAHNNGKLICHYCGYEEKMPMCCPKCGSKYIAGFGTGTQKVEKLVKKQFPSARVLRMDMDTTSKKGGHENILSAFANHEADILVGTQMIVKGHDFPDVTLVGVLAADLSLYASDYKAAERTFQLLVQAAGRAGRGNKEGIAVIQTYAPDNYSIDAASRQDYNSFYEEEIAYRKMLKYPPVSNMMAIIITSKSEDSLYIAIAVLMECIEYNRTDNMVIIGPANASIYRINDTYRKLIYIKHDDYNHLITLKNNIEKLIGEKDDFEKVSIQFDFTPIGGF
ncbi:MAG: primosomal protein N' [Eubacterium sp.]